jgi:hypothetical protein
MKISFCDFWQYPKSFNRENNFLFHLIKNFKENVQFVEPKNADVLIFSCFGNEHTNYDCKKIFFTGENKRPDFNSYDFSITFDFEDYSDRNIRIPLWLWYVDWFKVGTYDNPEYLIPEEFLYQENEFSVKPKNLFCSSVYSNPVNERSIVISLLNTYKKVDCYGKIGGFTSLLDGEKNKMEMISRYKFNVCFENSIHPGYYTEKLLHAKIAGTIPIYFSEPRMSEDFNKNCCLNFYDYNNTEYFLEKIIEIDSVEKKYKEIYQEPLFNKKIDLGFYGEKIISIL